MIVLGSVIGTGNIYFRVSGKQICPFSYSGQGGSSKETFELIRLAKLEVLS